LPYLCPICALSKLYLRSICALSALYLSSICDRLAELRVFEAESFVA